MINLSADLICSIVGHTSKADAWSLAYSSKRLYKIIHESNTFWTLLIKEIQNPEFTQKEAVLRCYKLIGDVKARDLYINIWIMLSTESFNQSPLMPLNLRVALITSNKNNFFCNFEKFWCELNQTEKQKICPALTESLHEMQEHYTLFIMLPEEIKQLIPFDPKYFDILPGCILALLAHRYIKSDSFEGIYLILSALQSRTKEEIELFFKDLLKMIHNEEHITVEFLEKTIVAMKRKNISLEKYPLISVVIHLENGLELAKLLVSHGAKIPTEFDAPSPINRYLTSQFFEKKINREILEFLEQHGDDFFKRYPIVKSLIETGDYSEIYLSFYMSLNEGNIEERLSNLSLSNWKPHIEQLTKVLSKKEFEVKHFIRLIENILWNSEYAPEDDNKIITIFECLKVRGVNLTTWENDGDTLLHMLFKGKNWNSSKLAEYLLDNKVDPLKTDSEGKYALNILLEKIFKEYDLSPKVRYFKAFRTVIQKMMAIDVPDFDKKNPFLYFQFSDTETLWLASLLGYRKLIESQLKPKDIQEVSAMFVSDDFEIITFMINSIKIDNTTTGSFMCYWYQFLEMLVADQDIFIREIIDLILNKLYTDMDPHFFDRRFSSSLETFILLHNNRRITTETFVDIVKKMPTIHNPQSGCAELIIYLQPLTTQQFWDNFKSTNIYVEAKDLNFKFEKTYEPHNKIHVITKNPLEDILKSKFANDLLLPLYELYPDWFKEPIFFNRLYRTLISETDQTLHDKYIEVCNFLLEKFPHNKSEISRRFGSDFFTFYGHFEKFISNSLSLQRHIVSHFFTAEMLNAPEKYKPYEINLKILFLKLIQFEPTQEFWDLIKTAIDRDDINYTEGVTFPTFLNLFEIFLKCNTKDKVKFQIIEFLWKKMGRTPTSWLHRIVEHNQTGLLEHMISVGHPVNHPENGTKNTPLHCACAKSSSLDCVKILLLHGADVTLKNANGKTAWDIAKRTKNFEMGWLLQENKFHHETLPFLMN